MPELPEVETIRRGLEIHLSGRRIVGVVVRETRLRRHLNRSRLRAMAIGREVRAVRRRAKYLILDLEPRGHVLIHLGMSGQLFMCRRGRPRVGHEHVVFRLDDGRTLRFADARRFGLVEPVSSGELEQHPLLHGLGPEPLADRIEPAELRSRTRGLRRSIKSFLLDSRAVAGVGNIYACEALFRARIHPAVPLRRVDERRWRILLSALRRVLREAVARGGTTLQDFVNAEGGAGFFQMRLRVYDRDGRPCPVCATRIRCMTQLGRSTYYCPRCQRRRWPADARGRPRETTARRRSAGPIAGRTVNA